MATKFSQRKKNLELNRSAVVVAATSAFLALQYTYFSIHEQPFEADTNKYVFENIGIAFLVAYALIPLILSLRYPLYWVFFSRDEKKFADERQRSVRRRVYESSYRLFAICSLAAYWLFNNPDHQMQVVMWWFVGITFFMMPIMVAAWQKDS